MDPCPLSPDDWLRLPACEVEWHWQSPLREVSEECEGGAIRRGTFAELMRAIASGDVPAEANVWRAGWSKWMPVSEVAGLGRGPQVTLVDDLDDLEHTPSELISLESSFRPRSRTWRRRRAVPDLSADEGSADAITSLTLVRDGVRPRRPTKRRGDWLATAAAVATFAQLSVVAAIVFTGLTAQPGDAAAGVAQAEPADEAVASAATHQARSGTPECAVQRTEAMLRVDTRALTAAITGNRMAVAGVIAEPCQ